MKKTCAILLSCWAFFASGQNRCLKINSNTSSENELIDEIGYASLVTNQSEIDSSFNYFIEKCLQKGFIDLIKTSENVTDNLITKTISLGDRYTELKISIFKPETITPEVLEKLVIPKTIAFENIVPTLQRLTLALDRLGYTFATVQFIDFQKKDNFINGKIKIILNQKRIITNFVVKGYPKFPPNYANHFQRKYARKNFSKPALEKINQELNSLRFVNSFKFPEILFTKDTTAIYIYVEKIKANRFDGFIGITTNPESKTVITGFLDLQLINAFNKGEKALIYWKDNGEDQKTISLNLELPYVFKSSFGWKSSLQILTLKNTFQNTQLNTNINYYLNFYSKATLGFETTNTTPIAETNPLIQNSTRNFWNVGYDFQNFHSRNNTLENIRIQSRYGFGKRKATTSNLDQQHVHIEIEKNIWLHPKHIINIQTQHFYLASQNYLSSELFRFGGLNSIRGFNENSLQGHLMSNLLTEYRLYLDAKSYVHSIFDYGYAKDDTTQSTNQFKSIGLGLGIKTKNGIMRILYANGSTNNQPFNISNSIVHIGFKSSF